jgi:hypothetical protein
VVWLLLDSLLIRSGIDRRSIAILMTTIGYFLFSIVTYSFLDRLEAFGCFRCFFSVPAEFDLVLVLLSAIWRVLLVDVVILTIDRSSRSIFLSLADIFVRS